MEFPFRGLDWNHSECRFLGGSTTISILILKPELTYDGGTASYHFAWNGISMVISPDWNYAESNQLYMDSSGTCGFGAYLDGAWFRGNCPHHCLKSWQNFRRLPETPPSSCGPFSVPHLHGRDQEVLCLLSQN